MTDKKKTKEELIKEGSDYLRGSIKKGLQDDTSYFEHSDTKVLKHHGVYQQDNRDTRQERLAAKQEKEYIFMVRTKLPGGKLSAKQYLGFDEISRKYGNNTLRITTRQTFQLHGVVKGNLHKTLNEINKQLILTYGSCGDVVRNVVACPVCDVDPKYNLNLDLWARNISNHFLPKTNAYYEIWVNGEKKEFQETSKPLISNVDPIEPIYGKTYLPRKFKIGLSLDSDNCIDVFIQDVGVVAITNKTQSKKNSEGSLVGFNILVGGGLGFTYNKPETYPRLASELGFVTSEKLLLTLEGIITIQRDYGGREDRKHARIKYLIDEKGLDWFKEELEKRISFRLESPKPVTSYTPHDHLGWNRQTDGKWYLGIFIENGRITDGDKRKIKTGLKEIIKRFSPSIRNSSQQNMILTGIEEKDKREVDKMLEAHNFHIVEKNLSTLRRNSIACVALPTCGLALSEAERSLPGIINELERVGLGNEDITIRMSGCPNSCSRTPVSEIAVIGLSANKYNIYVGGNAEGTKLNKLYIENIQGENVASEIARIIRFYKKTKSPDERFGDFCNKLGVEKLKDLACNPN